MLVGNCDKEVPGGPAALSTPEMTPKFLGSPKHVNLTYIALVIYWQTFPLGTPDKVKSIEIWACKHVNCRGDRELRYCREERQSCVWPRVRYRKWRIR